MTALRSPPITPYLRIENIQIRGRHVVIGGSTGRPVRKRSPVQTLNHLLNTAQIDKHLSNSAS